LYVFLIKPRLTNKKIIKNPRKKEAEGVGYTLNTQIRVEFAL